MDGELMCNFSKCKKKLEDYAWVTSCSHIFCDEDGAREFKKSYICPACQSKVADKYDVIRINLQPNEQYKSMVLAGQKPETIIDICSRAISFWTYQCKQEKTYYEFIATKAQEKNAELETFYEDLIARNKTEIQTNRLQCEALKKELETLKKRFNDTSEKMLEKNRQYQKLQVSYDQLKRRNVQPTSLEFNEVRPLTELGLTTAEDLLRKPGAHSKKGAINDFSHANIRRPDPEGFHKHIYRPENTEFHFHPVSDLAEKPDYAVLEENLGHK